jgi:hypothetical protein
LFGSFYRSFTLPVDADAPNIRAQGKDGVLSVHVQKLTPEQPRVKDTAPAQTLPAVSFHAIRENWRRERDQ